MRSPRFLALALSVCCIRKSKIDKAIPFNKVMENMIEQLDPEKLSEGKRKAQARIAEVESGAVQTISGDVALAQVRQQFLNN